MLTVLALTVVSCVSVYVATETDPDFSPLPKTSGYFVYTPSNATIQQKKLLHALRNAMLDGGFNLVETPADNNLVVMLFVGTHLYQTQSTMLLPRTSHTTGSAGGMDFSSTTRSTEIVPVTSSTFNYQISVEFLQWQSRPDNSQSKLVPVWRGYFDAPTSQVDAHPASFFAKILANYGQTDTAGQEYWETANAGDSSPTSNQWNPSRHGIIPLDGSFFLERIGQ